MCTFSYPFIYVFFFVKNYKIFSYLLISIFFFFSFFRIIGRPPPKVTWWRDNIEMIPSVSHPSADEGASAVVNQLFIGTITRDFYGTRLECRAQGSKLLPPVVKEITVQVHCESPLVLFVSKNYFNLTKCCLLHIFLVFSLSLSSILRYSLYIVCVCVRERERN